LEEREMQMLDRVQKAVAVYQEQLDAEAKDRQKRAVLELEERKRLEFEYALLLPSCHPSTYSYLFIRLSQKRDEFEKEFLARQHQLQEELMLKERDRELDKAKFKAEINTKYEQKLNALRDFQSTLQQQFAEYEVTLRNRYEKVQFYL
jgi:hypothetical protein